MDTTLRLSDVLSREIALEWFEAVAIVRDVADCIDDSAGHAGVPDLDQVQISSDGVLAVTATRRSDDSVRRLGQLLLACLVQSEPPVQLRLVASQATTPEPPFSSVRHFADALAYFERPDRRSVLRQLYARAVSAPSAPLMTQRPSLDLMVPLQPEVHEAAVETRTQPTRRLGLPRRSVVALAAGVVLVVATTTYSQFRQGGPTQEDVSAAATKATEALGTTLVKGISAVSETVGLGRLVPAGGTPGKTAAAPANPPSAPVAKPSAGSRSAAVEPKSFKLFDLDAVPALPIGVPVPAPTVRYSPPAPPEAAPALPDETIYAADDPGIVAPIGVRPQLPRVLPEDISRDRLSQIELIVLPDGTVGSVKLLGQQRSVLEAMLLSAAKAWKFRPAEKDGRPVTCRKIVWLVRD
jgi:hypothetical protein